MAYYKNKPPWAYTRAMTALRAVDVIRRAKLRGRKAYLVRSGSAGYTFVPIVGAARDPRI